MKNQLKPIAYSLMTLTALTRLGMAAETPFYDRPLHLVGEYRVTVKPNIMLYIDNSGSMSGKDVEESSGTITRIQAVRNTLSDLLNPTLNPRVEDYNWGVSYMNLAWGDRTNLATDVQTAEYSNEHRNKLLNSITHAKAYGASPGGEAFSRITKNMIKNIKYRCETNSIIFLSDGNINDNTADPPISGHKKSPKWGFIDGTSYNSSTNSFRGDEDQFWMKFEEPTEAIPNPPVAPPLNYNNPTTDYDRPPISYWDWIVPQKGFSSRFSAKPTINKWIFPHPNYGDTYGGYLGSGFSYNKDAPIGNMLGIYGLAYMSYHLSHSDLIKQGGPRGNTDVEGGLWDEEPFNKQTINTYTIAFGKGIATIPLANEYLDYGSRFGNPNKLGRYVAKDSKDLLDVINKIADQSTSIAKQAYSVGSPAVTPANAGAKLEAINTLVDTKNWSSQLQFLRIDSKGMIIKANNQPIYDLPSFGTAELGKDSNTRITLVNMGGTVLDLANDYKSIITADNFSLSAVDGTKEQQQKGLAKWLLRQSNQTDAKINQATPEFELRDRCLDDNLINCRADDPNRQMGDILNMPVFAIDDETRPTKKRSSFVVTAANDGMVHIFKDTNQTQPTENTTHYTPYELKLNYIPASIPRETASDTVLANLANTMHPDYGEPSKPHQFLINGGMQWMQLRTKNCNTTQECKRDKLSQVFIATTLGQGGKGVFALNLGGHSYKELTANNTTPRLTGLSGTDNLGKWQTEVPLWESGSEFPEIRASHENALDNNIYENKKKIGLGYTVGAPAVGAIILEREKDTKDKWTIPKLSSKRYYSVFVPNGYFSADKTPSLYVYNAMKFSTTENTGSSSTTITYHDNIEPTLIKKISVPLGVAGEIKDKNGLSAPTAVDYDLDGIIDFVYAGDYNGNLYRFDLRAENADNWKVSKIYSGSADQPITSAPSVASLNPSAGKDSKLVILFGTGSDLYSSDLTGPDSKRKQSFYGIYDDPAKEIADDAQPVVTYNNRNNQLLEQTITKTTLITPSNPDSAIRFVSDNPMDDKKQGWFIDLVDSTQATLTGERVTTKSDFTSRTVFFTTREYKSSANSDKKCSTATSNAAGYVYGLNIKTGGSLSAKTELFKQLTVKNNGFYASGYREVGALSPSSIISTMHEKRIITHGIENRSGRERSDFDARDFGVDCDPSMKIYVASSEYGLIDPKELICYKKMYKRISWREIF